MKEFTGIYGTIIVNDDGDIDYSRTDKRQFINIYEEEKKPSSEENDVELEGFSLYGKDDEPRYKRGKSSACNEVAYRYRKAIGRRLADGEPDLPIHADETDLWIYDGVLGYRADILKGKEINFCPTCGSRRTWDTKPLFAVWRCPKGC